MRFWALFLLFIMNSSFAASNAFIMRGGKTIPFTPEIKIELNDEVHSGDSFMMIQIKPQTKISMAKHTELLITEDSYVELKKGMILLKVKKDEQVVKGEAFSFRGTGQFEIALENSDVHLNVIKGQVQASSPYVQSFAPEIVKAKEGLEFNGKNKNFIRKKFAPKFSKVGSRSK
jgi:hypothetical protein